MTVELPSLDPIPTDIDEQIKRLLTCPHDPDIGDWLAELLQNSGHMSTGDDMRWRLLCMVWLTLEYDVEAGWPYLKWMNMGEPTISGHVSEMLIEAIDMLDAHVQMANWLANIDDDEQLQTFFQQFYPIPAQRNMAPLLAHLLVHPARPEVGVWLRSYCDGVIDHDSAFMRPWRLLTAAWYATAFNPVEGANYLKVITGGADRLSAEDRKLLLETTEQVNGTAALTQLIADCPDPNIKALLIDFERQHLPTVAVTTLNSDPDYKHLSGLSGQASTDLALFNRAREFLQQAGFGPENAAVLDLACGPLAAQTLLFSSAGYDVEGVDLEIPPGYLPTEGVKQWFRRRKHTKAWKDATAAYYRALAEQAGMPLHWKNADITMSDITRLDLADGEFEAVICFNYLQHAPNVNGLLAEATRMLKPGGLFVANIRPFAGFTGAFQVDPTAPWGHLRSDTQFEITPDVPLNRWRETQFETTIRQHLWIETWETEPDDKTEPFLTPEIEAELAEYTPAELTRKQIIVCAKRLS
jgi:SAM-dependent methyltransferase